MTYVRLDSGVLDSTLWVDRDARELFITALLMAVPHELTEKMPEIATRSLDFTGWFVPPGWYGKVEAAGVGIIRRAGVAEDAGLSALERLAATDQGSRSHAFDGRRLIRINGGFIVLNFIDYRDRDSTNAERQQRYRERQKALKAEKKEAARVTVTDKRVTITQQLDVDDDNDSDKDSSSPSTSPPADLKIQDVAKVLGVENEIGWVSMLSGMLEGLGTPKMQAIPLETLYEAATELAASGGDVTPHRFKAFVRKVAGRVAAEGDNGSTGQLGGKAGHWKARPSPMERSLAESAKLFGEEAE